MFQPIIETLSKNARRYNLLNSAVLELFKHIKDENIKTLITYIVENYHDKVKNVKYTEIFDQIKAKYDQNQNDEVSSFEFFYDKISLKIFPNYNLKFQKRHKSVTNEDFRRFRPDVRSVSVSNHFLRYRKGPSIRHIFQDDVEDKWFSDDEEEKVETKPVQPPPNKALVDYQDSDSDSEEKEPSSVADSGIKNLPDESFL